MIEILKQWGLVGAVIGWAITVGKFIQIISQMRQEVDQLKTNDENKTASLIKITEWIPEAKNDLLNLKTDMLSFRTVMAETQKDIAVALNSLNNNVKNLTDLAEKNIVLTNNRLAKLEDKTDNYDDAIKDFYQKYDLQLKK